MERYVHNFQLTDPTKRDMIIYFVGPTRGLGSLRVQV